MTITITRDVLDLTVQGPPPPLTWDRMRHPLWIWDPHGTPASDIWWSRLETCSNSFT